MRGKEVARKGSHLPLPSNDLGLPGWMGRIISLISISFQSSLHHVKSSHLGTSQHPRGPLPRGKEELYPAAPSGPSPAARPLRGDPHCLRQRPEGPETPCAPSWEPRTPRTRTGTRTRLGSRSGPALLERLGAGPAAASRDAGAGRTSGGCCSARGPQEPATRMVSGRAPDPGSCGWRGAEDASEYAGPLSGMRGSRCVSTSCLRCSD